MGQELASGAKLTCKLYINNKPVVVLVKNWSLEEDATEFTDDVCGENRSRFGKETNGFTLTFSTYIKDALLLQAYAGNQASLDALNGPQPVNAGTTLKFSSGNKAAFTLSGNPDGGTSLGPLKINVGGRRERGMMDVKIRAQNYVQAQ